MRSSENFATARDGTRIYWRASGTGSPAVLLTDGIACSGFIWKYLEPALARRWRTIRWNYRGHGRSESPQDLERVSIGDCVDDVLAVLDDAGERRVVLAGHSMGVQVALEAHRRAPERIAGLVLACGSPGRPLDTFHDAPVLSLVFPYLRRLVEAAPALARYAFQQLVPTELAYQIGRFLETNRHLVKRADLFPYLLEVSEVDPLLFVRMLASAALHDAADHLPSVSVPTLIIAGERDSWTPMWLSARMHDMISGSEMLVLPGGSHVGPLEHPELVCLRVEKFLRDRIALEPLEYPAQRESTPAGRAVSSQVA
jgi:pimeloyl-ACP methyl ester carboxylesterase